MNLLEILKENKGTVSSALGKKLAQQVLDGNIKTSEDSVEVPSALPIYNINIDWEFLTADNQTIKRLEKLLVK